MKYAHALAVLFLLTAITHGGIVPLKVDLPKDITAGSWPATFGIPMPQDAMKAGDDATVYADGHPIATQTTPLATWDAEQTQVRWLLVDMQVDAAQPTGRYELRFGKDATPAKPTSMATADDKAFHIDTGVRRFVVTREGQFALGDARFTVTDQADVTYTAHAESVTIEDDGPNRFAIKSDGWYIAADGTRFCKHNIRLAFFRNSSRVQVLHTWVFTGTSDSHQVRDLAMTIPLEENAQAATFGLQDGGHRIVNPGRVSLKQDCVNRFNLHYDLTDLDTNATLAEGEKVAGWCDISSPSGGVTAALREAWQNYPNEMEVAGNELRIHFWPSRGRIMDFRTEAMLAPYGQKGIETIRQFFLSQRKPYTRDILEIYNNAMGVGKTHELWLDFHNGHTTEQAVAALVAQGNTPVLVSPSPQWNCASGALGPLHPRDRDNFPHSEAALDAMFDRFINWRDHFADFGWHDYGDIHCAVRGMDWGHEVEGGQCAPLWRYWDSTHYGYPNTPWVLYFRSGERKYLQWGEANARHCMDIDICHHGDDGDRITGSHYYCNWSIVPWYGKPHTYVRIADYNKYEYLLYNYYMRGYRRAFEVLKEYGEAMVRYHDDTSVQFGYRMLKPDYKNVRHFGPPLGNLTELYRATWDERYLDVAHDYAKAIIDMYPEGDDEKFIAYAGKLRFCWQGMANYARLTGDPTFTNIMLRYAKNNVERGGDRSWSDVGYGYEFEPDQMWLDQGKARWMQFLATVNTTDDFQGRGSRGSWGAGQYPYAMRSLPVFMHAMANAPAEWRKRNLPLVENNRSIHLAGPRMPTLHIRPAGHDAAVQLRLTKDQEAFVTNADGKVIQHLTDQTLAVVDTITFPDAQAHTIHFPVRPTRHKGDYIVRGNVDIIDVQNLQMAIAPSTDDGGFCLFGPRVHFFVPKGVTAFTIDVETAETWGMYDWQPVVEVMDPAGNSVTTQTGGGMLQFNIAPKLEHTGQLWSLGPLGRVSAPKWPNGKKAPPYDAPFPAYFKLSDNLPQFVSSHPSLFFVPETGE